MRLRLPYQPLLLCLLVLVIFYPTLGAEVCLIDDQEMLNGMLNSGSLSLKNIFLPQIINGGYYRPLIGLSYYLDNTLWALDLRSMHLDNVLLHLVNVLLLFSILRIAIRTKNGIKGYLPLCGATLFAVHPIVTESINWISGRTDILAGNFVLASAASLLMYRKSRAKRYAVLTVVFIILGMLSKEASFGMILAAFFLLSADIYGGPEKKNDILQKVGITSLFRPSDLPFFMMMFAVIAIEVIYFGNYWAALAGCACYSIILLTEDRGLKHLFRPGVKKALLFGSYAGATGASYYLLRRLVYKSDVGKIGHTIKLMLLDVNYSISVFLGASGFYLKKFLLPLPLNFYLLEIDPLYDLAGILLLLFCLRLLTRLNLSAAFFIAGVCMFLPALPFAFGTIAWTGYAERYIYISTAFWIVAIIIYLDGHLGQRYSVACAAVSALVTLTLFYSWQTFSRNLVWQKNVSLFEDTVRQSPRSRRLRDMYMYALYKAGDIRAAKGQYAVGQTLYSLGYDETADLLMAQILNKEGRPDQALELYETVIRKTRNSSETALKRIIRQLETMLSHTQDSGRSEELYAKKRTYETLLGEMTNDPMVVYNLGQKALAANDRKSALGFFIRAQSAFASTSPYRVFSAKLIDRLKEDR